jgi:hypothetical protein
MRGKISLGVERLVLLPSNGRPTPLRFLQIVSENKMRFYLKPLIEFPKSKIVLDT